MANFRSLILFFLMLMLLPRSGHARLDFEDAIFPELGPSGRALAMGNAFIARVDDSSAVYYNPAGLGSVRLTHFHLSNFYIETNKGLLNSQGGGNSSQVMDKVANGFDLDGTRKTLLENRGTISNVRLNMMPNLTTRYMAMGYLLSFRRKAYIGQEENAEFEFASREDHGPFWSLNLSLFGGVFKLGASATYLNRKELILDVSRDSEVTVTGDSYFKGKMLYGVVGGRLTLPFAALPTIAATMHNATDNEFRSGRGAGVPDRIKQNIVYGVSITPQLGPSSRVHIEVNYKDAGQEYEEVSSSRRIQAGVEFDFNRFFFVRMGYGDGFGSCGLGLKSRKLEVDLSTYAVDTSADTFRGREDRRFILNLSSGI